MSAVAGANTALNHMENWYQASDEQIRAHYGTTLREMFTTYSTQDLVKNRGVLSLINNDAAAGSTLITRPERPASAPGSEHDGETRSIALFAGLLENFHLRGLLQRGVILVLQNFSRSLETRRLL